MPKKQKDGRYRAKIIIGYDANDKPVYKYASGRTRKELEANKREILRIHTGGLENVQFDTLFGSYAVKWYEVYKKRDLSASTRANYSTALNKHLIPAFGDRQLRAIRAIELQEFMNEFTGMGRSTIGDIYSILVNVFRRAAATGIIERDPTQGLTKPEAKAKSKRALSEAETAAALTVARTHKHGLLLLLLYYTGARRGEVLGLRWKAIDLKNRCINIQRDVAFVTNNIGEVKSSASVRSVPMPDELHERLDACPGIGETFVILAPKTLSHLSQVTFKRWWEQLQAAMLEADESIEKCELPSSKAARKKDSSLAPVYGSILTPHYFRHNYASILYNAGVDVLTAQRFLGHADAKTTLSIYTHLAKKKEQEGADKIQDAFKKVAEKLPN